MAAQQHNGPVPENAWQHLEPLVTALIDDGNRVVDGGFRPNQGGWDCWMRDPLNFDVLRPLIETDGRDIRMVRDEDAVHCLHCWASIRGPALI